MTCDAAACSTARAFSKPLLGAFVMVFINRRRNLPVEWYECRGSRAGRIALLIISRAAGARRRPATKGKRRCADRHDGISNTRFDHRSDQQKHVVRRSSQDVTTVRRFHPPTFSTKSKPQLFASTNRSGGDLSPALFINALTDDCTLASPDGVDLRMEIASPCASLLRLPAPVRQ